ncbi:MAG: GspE/PulE family protein [Candidatus Rokuibacteriota bacterium]
MPDAPPISLPDRVSRDFLLHHRICPTAILPDGALAVAVTEESLLGGLDDLSVAYDRRVIPQPLAGQKLDALIARLTSGDEGGLELAHPEDDEERFTSDIRDLANQPPVVRYVNLLIHEAYEAGASDIHLESTREGLVARFRIDGVLVPALEPPGRMDRAVVSRVKLLADLDIAERRRPQDGRIRVRLKDRELDLRVSTVPTALGESVALRLLERGGGAIALGVLGLPAGLLAPIQRLAQKPHGMILVTGPTGSGKTTTLYAALGLRSAAAEKIITLEDPVEYTLAGVTQVPVHVQTGVTFASMLRSILRQDPDVVLVGEMRDAETAELAVQAALTGHVVFSTLHTNDALGAIPRLLDLGVAPFLVSATLEAVLAQRLVRRICDECREPYVPEPHAVALLHPPQPPPPFTHGRGCAACRGTGYRGRIGLFELLVLTDEVRETIVAEPSRRRIEELARADGMVPLRADGWAKVVAGITTVEEVLRVTEA